MKKVNWPVIFLKCTIIFEKFDEQSSICWWILWSQKKKQFVSIFVRLTVFCPIFLRQLRFPMEHTIFSFSAICLIFHTSGPLTSIITLKALNRPFLGYNFRYSYSLNLSKLYKMLEVQVKRVLKNAGEALALFHFQKLGKMLNVISIF